METPFILEFYDHGKTRIRATAQVVFADVVDRRRAQEELIELLSWVRDRCGSDCLQRTLTKHNKSFMEPQALLELPCSVRRRMHAERVLICLEEHSSGLWRIEMANAHAHAAAKQEAAVARCRFVAAAALDNAGARAENRCERLVEGFVRERDCSAVADVVLADLGVQLRSVQALVSEFQDTALGVHVQVDEFVEQYAVSTKRVIDWECSDVKKHERDLVENAQTLTLGTTELWWELQQARMQISRGSGLAAAAAETIGVCSCGTPA